MRRIFQIGALLIALCAFTLNIKAQSKDNERGYVVKTGEQAPNFTMELLNGETIELASLKGKVVMLQFTASWCGVCRKEMPFIEKDIWLKHKNNPDFALFAIDRGETKEKVEQLVKSTGITYPIGFDPTSEIFFKYAEKNAGITRNIIINKEGKIIMLTRLFEPAEFEEMCKTIDNLLK
ncbi:MAG: TlpA family protein disulfide reductase [Bacteroidales bacterium]